MSMQETHFGKLVKIAEGKEEVKKKSIELMKELNIDFDPEEDDIYDLVYDTDYRYVIINNVLYRNDCHESIYDDPFFGKMFKDSDGNLIYACSFYNGGTCFPEMLDDMIKDIE